jgi:hypothetical protein
MPIPVRSLLMILLCGGLGFALPATTCSPGTAVAKQSRSKMKHRQQPAHGGANRVQVALILQWKTPVGVPSSAAAQKSAIPIDLRESQSFTVEGERLYVREDL